MAPQMRKHRQVFFRAFPEHTISFQKVKVSKLRYFKKKFFLARTIFKKCCFFGCGYPPKHAFFSKKFQKFWFKSQHALYTRVKITKILIFVKFTYILYFPVSITSSVHLDKKLPIRKKRGIQYRRILQ